MPDKKISELDPITTLDGTEEFAAAVGATETNKITADDMATFFGTAGGGGGGGALVSLIDELTADVAITATGTFHDLVSVTLDVGTWVLIGKAIYDGNGNPDRCTLRLTDGTNIADEASSRMTPPEWLTLNCVALVEVTSGTPTWTLQLASNGGSSNIEATAEYLGTANKATKLVAIRIDPGSGGGGGGGIGSIWSRFLDEDGSSLAEWTQVSGSWSVVSDAFHVDTTSGSIARLKFNTAFDPVNSIFVFAADVKVSSAGIGSDAPAGLLFDWSGSGGGSYAVQLFKAGGGAGTKQIRTEYDQSAANLGAFTPSPTWALDAYSRLLILVHGSVATIFLDGVNVGQTQFTANQGWTAPRFVGLVANNAVVDFQNITLDYLALPDATPPPSGGGGVVDPILDVFGAPDHEWEFDTATLTGLSSLASSPTVEDADTTTPGHYHLQAGASSGVFGRFFPMSSPLTVITRLWCANRGNNEVHGACICEASPGKIELAAAGVSPSGGNGEEMMLQINYSNPTTFAGASGVIYHNLPRGFWYSAIRAWSDTDVDYLFSYDGRAWQPMVVGRNPGMTIGGAGVALNPPSAAHILQVDFLRIWDSALTFPGVP
jgi:hypothetical protein